VTDPFALSGQVEVIAHRGYSAAAPENTATAIRMGLDAGADAVEFDLHTAGDGTPVLLHDETLDRTTDGSGSIFELAAQELEGLDAGSWFDPRFTGEPLPTLADALAVAGDAGRIYAEVKGLRQPDDVHEIVRVVRAAGAFRRTVFISMDWSVLDRIRDAERAALVGFIVEARDRAEPAIERAGGDPRALVDFDRRILLSEPELVGRAARRGVALATWTVDDTAEAATLAKLGVPRITTNRVAELVAWRDGEA